MIKPLFIALVVFMAFSTQIANADSKTASDHNYFDRLFIACSSLESDNTKVKCLINLHNQLKSEINIALGGIKLRDRQHVLNTKGVATTILKEDCKANFSGWVSQQCIINADISLYNYLAAKKE